MTIIEKIKELIKKARGVRKLSDNPNSPRYNFINNIDTVRKQHLEECKIWYIGDSDELLNFYTNRDMTGNYQEAIYNRNKPFYFWGINPKETKIKRVHSGLPNAIVSTLSNAIGVPMIQGENEEEDETLSQILDANNFNVLLNQQQRPLTLVEGWGAYKINFDKSLSSHPIIQYYEADDVDFIVNQGIVVGIIYKDYYQEGDDHYILFDVRSVKDKNSIIEYKLYKLSKSNELEEVDFSKVPALASLEKDGLVIQGFNKILGVPCRYFFDAFNKNYGRSIFTGKIDLFDDLDQSLSQRSQTCRCSTPVEYFPSSALERTDDGKPIMPSVYNRQFIKSVSMPDGDGNDNGQITTTQPLLNFDQYSQEQVSLVNMILTGILSPASMGIDLAKKDNADAQREKEKVTIMTRNNVMAMEEKIIKQLCDLCLSVQEYMDKGTMTIKDHDISVKYSEFANPSFESLSATLTPMFTNGAISTKMFVEKLYGDSLSDEEKQEEIAYLENEKSKDNMSMGDFGLGNEEDEARTREDLSQQEENDSRTE